MRRRKKKPYQIHMLKNGTQLKNTLKGVCVEGDNGHRLAELALWNLSKEFVFSELSQFLSKFQ